MFKIFQAIRDLFSGHRVFCARILVRSMGMTIRDVERALETVDLGLSECFHLSEVVRCYPNGYKRNADPSVPSVISDRSIQFEFYAQDRDLTLQQWKQRIIRARSCILRINSVYIVGEPVLYVRYETEL